MSSASGPRHSPTTIRSGRIRSAFRSRSRMLTSPWPSTFAGRASSVMTWICCSRSSAASSMVTIRSRVEMYDDSAFISVVFPAPLPPDTMTLRRPRTHARRNWSASGVMDEWRRSSSGESGSRRNLRTVRTGPTSESGGMTAFTRDPSGRRASTMGDASSQRRPSGAMIRWMTRMTWSVSAKVTSVRYSLPSRSIQTWWAPFTMISEIPSS